MDHSGTRPDPKSGVGAGSELTRALVAAWGSWSPSMSPDGEQVTFVSDRNGRPELWVQDVGGSDEPSAPARLIRLSDDPVVSAHWSADGEWLAALVATDGGVRTQVWVVRPDGTGARCVAGSRERHAALGPWTRVGHELVVAMPPAGPLEESRCDLVDPATGRHEPLAHGVLVDVLDLSPDRRFALLAGRDARGPVRPHPGSSARHGLRPAALPADRLHRRRLPAPTAPRGRDGRAGRPRHRPGRLPDHRRGSRPLRAPCGSDRPGRAARCRWGDHGPSRCGRGIRRRRRRRSLGRRGVERRWTQRTRTARSRLR